MDNSNQPEQKKILIKRFKSKYPFNQEGREKKDVLYEGLFSGFNVTSELAKLPLDEINQVTELVNSTDMDIKFIIIYTKKDGE